MPPTGIQKPADQPAGIDKTRARNTSESQTRSRLETASEKKSRIRENWAQLSPSSTKQGRKKAPRIEDPREINPTVGASGIDHQSRTAIDPRRPPRQAVCKRHAARSEVVQRIQENATAKLPSSVPEVHASISRAGSIRSKRHVRHPSSRHAGRHESYSPRPPTPRIERQRDGAGVASASATRQATGRTEQISDCATRRHRPVHVHRAAVQASTRNEPRFGRIDRHAPTPHRLPCPPRTATRM